jgi:hypothetical protein
MGYPDFKDCIQHEFKSRPVPEHLIQALFNRFRLFKLKENSEGIDWGQELDINDFLLALTLLSRIPADHKIKRKLNLLKNFSFI